MAKSQISVVKDMLSYQTVGEKIKSCRVHCLPQNSSKVGVFCLATPRSRQETDACFFLLPYAMSNADEEDEYGMVVVGIKGNQQL